MSQNSFNFATSGDKTSDRIKSASHTKNVSDTQNSVTKCYTVLDVPIYSVEWWAQHGVIARQGRVEGRAE